MPPRKERRPALRYNINIAVTPHPVRLDFRPTSRRHNRPRTPRTKVKVETKGGWVGTTVIANYIDR